MLLRCYLLCLKYLDSSVEKYLSTNELFHCRICSLLSCYFAMLNRSQPIYAVGVLLTTWLQPALTPSFSASFKDFNDETKTT